MKRFIGICIGVFVIGFIGQASAASKNWTLKDINGEHFTLSENLGEGPTLLLFWSTWCRPCKQEMKEYKSIFEDYLEKGIQILAIAEDNSKTRSKVKPFIQSTGYKFTVLHDPTGEVLKSYGGMSIPFTVVLDREGRVQKTYRGKIRKIKKLSELLEELLIEPVDE